MQDFIYIIKITPEKKTGEGKEKKYEHLKRA